MRDDEKKIVLNKTGKTIEPNCIAVDFEDEKFKFHFGNVEKQKEKDKIEILAEVKVNEEGFKAIFKKTLEVLIEYGNANDRNLLKELIAEVNNNETL